MSKVAKSKRRSKSKSKEQGIREQEVDAVQCNVWLCTICHKSDLVPDLVPAFIDSNTKEAVHPANLRLTYNDTAALSLIEQTISS